jgi:xanthine dehydrogenase accessory factor
MENISSPTVCGPTDSAMMTRPIAEGVTSPDLMYTGVAGIISSYQQLRQTETDFVLATIVETQGSTYRKAGASMLISRSGYYCGLLGGGCFESDLLEHAGKVFASHQPLQLLYDMRSPEDLVWGLGLGCNGAVRIWLEYVSAENNYMPLSLLETALSTESPAVIVSCLASEAGTTRHYLFGDANRIPIELHPPAELIDMSVNTLDSGEPALLGVSAGGEAVTAFFSRISPPVNLLVIGGGPDALPVTNLARLLGWQVTVVDYRENYARAGNFPAAQRVICATPEQLADRINLDNTAAVVLMTHKYEYDLRYLQQLTNPALRYIGLLGPTARRNELLRACGSAIAHQLTDRVYGPVGLNIGGELPEEIALSLLAEIQAVLNGRPGGHLAPARQDTTRATPTGKLGCIVLAAGGSTRFGALKQLLEFNGKSLLNRIVGIACGLVDNRVLVVHGPKPTKCQRDIATYKVKNLVNEDWADGMSGSITLAVRAVPEEYAAVLLVLCDQPLIGREQLERLVQAWTQNPDRIIASRYAGTTGVPAIIPRKYFRYLLELNGDQGARKLLNKLASEVTEIPMPEAEFDIDTQEDFARLLFRDTKSG